MDVCEYEGESEADTAFWALHPDWGDDLRAHVERLRPPRPFWISDTDPDAMTRWAFPGV